MATTIAAYPVSPPSQAAAEEAAERCLQDGFRRMDTNHQGVVPLGCVEAVFARASPGLPPRQLRQLLRNFRQVPPAAGCDVTSPSRASNGEDTEDALAGVEYTQLIDWLFKPPSRTGVAVGEVGAVVPSTAYALLPGLGNADYPGFPADGSPATLPDLTMHRSCSAAVLRSYQSTYSSLKDTRTKGGVSFARCIKPGMDSPSAMIVGVVAADEDSYKTFAEHFDQVIQLCHGGYPADATHPTDLSPSKVNSAPVDPAGKHAGPVRLTVSRNLRGFRFGPACSCVERRTVEKILLSALTRAAGSDVHVEYYPLRHSSTFTGKPQGMTEADEQHLLRAGLLFTEPRCEAQLAAGLGRHWPDARGVAVMFSKTGSSRPEQATSAPPPTLTAWINQEDHLCLDVSQEHSDVKAAFAHLSDALAGIKQGLEAEGTAFARTDRLGYLTVCPSRLGTALCASVDLRLPLLSSTSSSGLHDTCYALGLKARAVSAGCELWEIANRETLGCSEVDLVNNLIAGCARLVELEKMLLEKRRSRQRFDPSSCCLATSVFAMLPGLGADEYPGFPTRDAPQLLRSVSQHRSVVADVFRSDPSMYGFLRDRRTPRGVCLAHCIKPGMDSPSSTVEGVVACDEDSYDTFRELFHPVIKKLHDKHSFPVNYPNDLSIATIQDTLLDPDGEFVMSCEIVCRRNVSDFRFPPVCHRGERQRLERLLATSLFMLPKGDFSGQYYPLRHSSTYHYKPDGMTNQEAQDLEKRCLLFHEPQSPPKLASGMGRHWPEARGVFVAESRRFAAWLNEEDHLKVMSMRAGGDLKATFALLVEALSSIERGLELYCHGFARSDQLGFLTTSPLNVGTGLSIKAMLRLPLLSCKTGFQQTCRHLGLKSRPCETEAAGMWEVSMDQVFGCSEADLVNSMLDSCGRLIRMEKALASGSDSVQPLLDEVVSSGKKAVRKDSIDSQTAFGLLPGLGDHAPQGFPVVSSPERLPELSRNRSAVAEVLRKNLDMYETLRHKKTSRGVTLAGCIKPGMDNPALDSLGLAAGDQDCYDVFRCLFDEVIGMRNPEYKPTLVCRSDFTVDGVASVPIDASGKFVISVRVDCRRNVSGFRFPSACDRAERRAVEQLLLGALEGLEDAEATGHYSPLPHSESVVAKPTGMTHQEEVELSALGYLFHEPRSSFELSAGMGRHWPDARGVFVANSKKLMAWCNERDHLYMMSHQAGADLREAFQRLAEALGVVERKLADATHSFAFSSRLGYLTSFPSDLGTGLMASATLIIPRLACQLGFQDVCQRLGLTARPGPPAAGRDTWEVGNAPVLGRSPAQVLNTVILGCTQLVLMERALEGDQEVIRSLSNNLRTSLDECSRGQAHGMTALSVEVLLKQVCPGLPADELKVLLSSVPSDAHGNVPFDALVQWIMDTVRLGRD